MRKHKDLEKLLFSLAKKNMKKPLTGESVAPGRPKEEKKIIREEFIEQVCFFEM